MDESVLQEATRNTSVRELFAKRTDDPGDWFAGDVVPPRVRFPDGHAPRSMLWREAAAAVPATRGGASTDGRVVARGFQGFLFLVFPNFCLVPSSFLLSAYFAHRYTFLPSSGRRAANVRQRSNSRQFRSDPMYRATFSVHRWFRPVAKRFFRFSFVQLV